MKKLLQVLVILSLLPSAFAVVENLEQLKANFSEYTKLPIEGMNVSLKAKAHSGIDELEAYLQANCDKEDIEFIDSDYNDFEGEITGILPTLVNNEEVIELNCSNTELREGGNKCFKVQAGTERLEYWMEENSLFNVYLPFAATVFNAELIKSDFVLKAQDAVVCQFIETTNIDQGDDYITRAKSDISILSKDPSKNITIFTALDVGF